MMISQRICALNGGLLVNLIRLIDWCLTPTLAVFQIYHDYLSYKIIFHIVIETMVKECTCDFIASYAIYK